MASKMFTSSVIYTTFLQLCGRNPELAAVLRPLCLKLLTPKKADPARVCKPIIETSST